RRLHPLLQYGRSSGKYDAECERTGSHGCRFPYRKHGLESQAERYRRNHRPVYPRRTITEKLYIHKTDRTLKKLKDILYKVRFDSVKGKTDREVNALKFDSHKLQPKDVFIAIRGSAADGHEFIDAAIEKGATTIVCENLPEALNENLTYVKVADSQEALALM